MDLVVNEELKAYIDPLTPDEHDALERSILAEGCRDALVLWGDMLVDGHNRYGICRKHGLPFQTVQSTRFQSLEDVHLWMIDQHLGRRSLSDYQRGVLALRKREIVSGQRARRAAEPAETATAASSAPVAAAPTLDTREALAKAARISSNQVAMIEKIRQQAAPEVVEAVKAGTISINAAAAVASLPAEEQVAAAVAGKDELKQAAKRARESRRKAPADESAAAPQSEQAQPQQQRHDGTDTLDALRQRVATLTAENASLKLKIADLHAQLRANAGEADTAPF